MTEAPTCTKIRYLTRRQASRDSRRVDNSMRPYLCSECGFWHLGHLPAAVRKGEISAARCYP